MSRVEKDPRVVKCAAADTHAGATGFFDHLFRRFWRRHVAIANHRDDFYRPGHGADPRKVDCAAETLFAGAPMHEDRRHTDIFKSTGQIWRRDVLIIPSEAHLGGDRYFDCVHHALDQPRGPAKFRHHRRTAAYAADLAHRASHVDVH